MFDTVIKNGRFFDGLGTDSRLCDVAIRDGKIVAIEPNIEGEAVKVVEAKGLWVTPGFIDIHTHYDLELEIAPSLEESVRHGVTSVVMGNCSLSVAMGDPQDLADIFLRVEALPKELITKWLAQTARWDNTEHYLKHLDQDLAMGPNVAALLGHSALRCKVMGLERSLNEHATPQEIEEMRILAEAALKAGFLGISIDMIPWHMVAGRFAGRTLPSQHASMDEYRMLAQVCADADGIFQLTPNPQNPMTGFDIIALLRTKGKNGNRLRTTILTAIDSARQRLFWRAFSLFLFFVNTVLKCNARFQTITEPFRVYSDGPITTLFEEFSTGVELNNLETRSERLKLWREPGFKQRFKTEWVVGKHATSPRDFGLIRVVSCPQKQWIGKTIHDVAALWGKTPIDAFADLLETYDTDFRWVVFGGNDRLEQRLSLMGHPEIHPGFTDAGAHNRNMAFFDGTVSFLRQAQQTGFMSMERAISRCTGEVAQWFRLDAGVLEVGKKADVTLIDPTHLHHPIPDPIEHDDPLLAGAMRMVKRDPDGIIRGVFIGGQQVVDQAEPTPLLGQTKTGDLLSLSDVNQHQQLVRRSHRDRINDLVLDHPLDYWEVFVLKHQSRWNIFFHLLGIAYFYLLIIGAWRLENPWLLLAIPLSNLIGLIGHVVFEHSHVDVRDALYSVRASNSLNKLLYYQVTGKYQAELERVQAKLQQYKRTRYQTASDKDESEVAFNSG